MYTNVEARKVLEEVRFRERQKNEKLSLELKTLEHQRKYALDRDQVDREIKKKLESHDKTQKLVKRAGSDREGHYGEILQRKVDWKKEVQYLEKNKQPIENWMYRKANDGVKE